VNTEMSVHAMSLSFRSADLSSMIVEMREYCYSYLEIGESFLAANNQIGFLLVRLSEFCTFAQPKED
jgi:hypothetical protein